MCIPAIEALEKLGKKGGRRMMSERTGNVKILVSTCLVGINSQWDEGSAKVDDVVELVRSGKAVFLCPEQLGGLSTPRDPAEIEPGKTAKDVLEGNGRVLTPTGKDFTKQFVCGAQRLLAFCQEMGIETAILKAGSPSCGSRETYDGTFSETMRPGKGTSAELLDQNGIEVYNEGNYPAGILES
jgi:uncharacterized protein YbbK (DUF523 family)